MTNLTTHERRQSLSELLRKQPGLRVPELAKALGISEGTVRNDLNALEKEGILTRVHGGAVLKNNLVYFDASFGLRFQGNALAKQAIARQAAKLVSDGASILLDASTSIYYLAQQLAQYRRLRVLTNGIEVARLLARDPTNTVVLIGGVVNPEGSSVSGNFSEKVIRDLHVNKAFVSGSGFSLERGLTDVYLAEAELKTSAIASAQEIYALVDSSKIGVEDLTSFARLEQITHLFTDSGLSAAWLERLRSAGVPFTICSAE